MYPLLIAYALRLCTRSDLRGIAKRLLQIPLYQGHRFKSSVRTCCAHKVFVLAPTAVALLRNPRIHLLRLSIPSFADTQGISYLPDTASQGSLSPLLLLSAPSPPSLPGNGALARHSINVHRAALLHRSCTPMFIIHTNMPFFPGPTAQFLMSLQGVVGEASVPTHNLRACVPPMPGIVRERSLLKMEKA